MSISTEINRIKTAATSIVQAIRGKGITVPDTAKIGDLSAFVNEIGTVVQLDTLVVAPMTNAEINANLVAGAFVKVANNFVTMSDLANGATVNNVAIPSGNFYELFEGVISTQQMQFISVLPVAVGKNLDGIVFSESGIYVMAQMCQSGFEITIPNFRFIRTLEVVERGTTTLTSRRNTSNNTIVFTAENNQKEGYSSGGKSTATKTVSLSVSGTTVTASDGSISISMSVSDANLVAGNIKKGVSIFGVAGSYEGEGGGINVTLPTRTVTVTDQDYAGDVVVTVFVNESGVLKPKSTNVPSGGSVTLTYAWYTPVFITSEWITWCDVYDAEGDYIRNCPYTYDATNKTLAYFAQKDNGDNHHIYACM